MDEIKKQLVNITEKLATNDTRLVKMEITIYGSEGHGGLYEKIESLEKSINDKIDSIEKVAKEQSETTKEMQKQQWKAYGFIAAICFFVPIILKFINL